MSGTITFGAVGDVVRVNRAEGSATFFVFAGEWDAAVTLSADAMQALRHVASYRHNRTNARGPYLSDPRPRTPR